jgi:hypothetical protein
MMQTDRLIHALATDFDKQSKSLSALVVVAMLVAAPFAAGMFMMRLGLRPDIAAAADNPFFLLKFAVTLALLAVAAPVAIRLARPAHDTAALKWLFAIPLALLVAAIAADVSVQQPAAWTQRLMGANARICMMAIPMLSLPFLAGALIALRKGASIRPALTGAAAGAMSGSLGAALYAAHCGDDSPLFVAVWYSIAIAAVSALGALLGNRLLRF